MCKVYKSDVCKKGIESHFYSYVLKKSVLDKTTGTVVNRVHFRFGQRVVCAPAQLLSLSPRLHS